jgi:hypothetical protein
MHLKRCTSRITEVSESVTPLSRDAQDIAEKKSPANGPIPTFASLFSGHFANVGIEGPLENIDSSEALDLRFAYEYSAGAGEP